MALIYTNVDNIKLRLTGRLNVNSPTMILGGGSPFLGGQTVNADLINLVAEEVEEFLNSLLNMIYVMPLALPHSVLNGICEKLVISELMTTYFQGSVEGLSSDPGFGAVMRDQSLNTLQGLFIGTGIVVPGSTQSFPENQQNSRQLNARFVPLQGEVLKQFIGVDQDGDNIVDSDLWATGAVPSTIIIGSTDGLEPSSLLVQRQNSSTIPIDFYNYNHY